MNGSAEGAANGAVTAASQTLLEQLGGEPGLDALIGAFLFNILVDDRVGPFFADRNVEAILNHQRMFFATVLGIEDRYRGRRLREAHRDLVERSGLNGTHFDAVVEILSSTLVQFGCAHELRRAVLDRVVALRDEVIGS